MFFYGTLKRGHRNHDPFCRGGRFVGEATLRGKVYGLPLGYPALIVPEEDVFAVGTAAPLSDAADQRRLACEYEEARPPGGPRVFGELFAFDDPETRLPALDRLEGFDPEDGSSPYRRVLLPVETTSNDGVLAWAYVVEATSGVHLPEGRWPA
jgi:gamma-glutamylcyclotransferase (GGCT)/AIG2-like uncharacterized protein YtfP